MGERLIKVEEMIKKFDSDRKNIHKKYKNEEDIKKMKEIDIKLNRSNLHIERLKEELKAIPENEKDLVAEYKRQIEMSEDGDERKELLKQKSDLDTKIKINTRDADKKIEAEEFDLENKLRADLTQESIKIDNDIERLKFNMQGILLDMKSFDYKYEEKDGARVCVNGQDYKALDDKYKSYQDDLEDLKNAKKLCESKLEEYRQRDNKRAEELMEKLNGKDTSESKGQQDKLKKGEIETEEKHDKNLQQNKITKEEIKEDKSLQQDKVLKEENTEKESLQQKGIAKEDKKEEDLQQGSVTKEKIEEDKEDAEVKQDEIIQEQEDAKGGVSFDDLVKADDISRNLLKNNFTRKKVGFKDFEKTGKNIKEIICQTKLGVYLVEKTDGTIEYFDAKREGAIDNKTNKKLAKEFSGFSKKDLKGVDLNILKILKQNGFDDKKLKEYIEGKNEENRFRTVYSNDMTGKEYKDEYKNARDEKDIEIDKDTKLKKLKLSQKNFFKKLTRTQGDRLDTYVTFDNRTLIQKISHFFDKKTLIDAGTKITDEELEELNPHLKDKRLLEEAHMSEINKGINARIYDPKISEFNKVKDHKDVTDKSSYYNDSNFADVKEEAIKNARENFVTGMKVTPEQAGENAVDKHIEDLIEKASKEAGVEVPTKKDTSNEQER